MNRAFGFIYRTSFATACFLFTLSGQTTQHPNDSASGLVEQFETTRAFWEQFEVAKKIVALHDRSVLPELERWLDEKDMRRRGNAAFIFARLGDDRGFEIIKDILESRSTERTVAAIDDAGHPDLQLQIRDDRYYAAHLFGDLRNARAVPILIPFLKDEEVRLVVPWSLGEIGDKSAIPALIEMLGDKNPDMRVSAIYALEELKAREALPQLRPLTDDEERIHFDGLGTVAEAAKAAIARLEEIAR